MLATALITSGLAAAVSPQLASAATGGALLYGLTTADHVVSFRQTAPGTAVTDKAITGLGSDHLVGLDIRPATGDVVALSNTGKLYTLVPSTGVATLVATVTPAFTGGADAGVDFNPVPDRLRITGTNDQNLRVVPTTGAATVDTPLAYALTDVNTGKDPNIEASAYTNSFAGATTTTLYDIDTTLDILVTQNPPNNGTLNTVGALGVDATGVAGLDIDAATGTATALLTVGGVQNIYTINLTSGAATLVGPAVAGLIDVTVATPQLRVTASSVAEGSSATVTITRTGDLADAATVDYATSSGTATTAADFTAASGTATFAPGAATATFTVPTSTDAVTEGPETVTITLSNPTAGTVLSPAVGTLTIKEPDQAYALTTDNKLATFALSTPGTSTATVGITGTTGAEDIVGIDIRPATNTLLGLGASGRLYTINPATGVATAIGTGTAPTLTGASFGLDVNPTVDRVRVVSDADQNLRLNPTDGTLAAADTALAYAVGDPNTVANPNVIGAAYTNSVAGATTTTLFDIDSTLDVLVTQNPPNSGTLNTVGALGVDVTAVGDLDIAPAGNTAFAALTPAATGIPTLYRIDLTTGTATSLGAFALPTVEDLAIGKVTPPAPPAVPTFILGTNVIAAGQTTKVVVTGDAGDKVDVLVKGAASSTYTVIATLTLNSAGGSSLIVSPSTSSSYVVRNATGTAAPKFLLVKAVQSVVVNKSGTTGIFSGLVKPSLQGRTVIVYYYVTGGHVTTACTTVVRAGGKFACNKTGFTKGQLIHVFAQTGADKYNAAGRSGLKDLQF